MAAAVAICRADWQCIDYIQAAFCKVGMKKELDAVDQAGYRVVATKNIFAISERNVVENAFDKYRKKLAGGGISENDCQLIITAAKKAVADLETILRNYPPK
jgi:hypothetical protein